ncbi:GGDEF domain-containing protein [Methylobacterium sp. 77]|uniref:GGDEF domain-containing protein n=1 Tax=Methylobacterium sp. 77 TaxID=1101192 RepID=UPI000379FBA1|nr:GGDEF domain-containing protein [Methylobacterium sp. 77]
MLDVIDRQMRSKSYGLAFDAELEERFEDDTREKRVRDIRRTIVLGLVVFHIYNVAGFVTTPDLALLNLGLRIFGMTPLALLIIWAVGRVDGPVREAIGGIGMLAATGIPILIFWMGTGPLVSLTTATIWLSVLFANITLPLRFFWACFVSSITAVAVLAGLYLKPEIAASVGGVLGLDMVTGILFSLVATYRIESANRRDYLVNLRETLRANRLAADNTTLVHLSSTDPLTGIANRRAFARELGEFWEASLSGRHFAVMLIDIDHFKLFNDYYGHGAGDTCLREVSGILAKTAAGSGAFVARYGGEEFAVLIHTRDPDEAHGLAERFRRSVAEKGLLHGNRNDDLDFVSVSVGVSTSCGMAASSSALIEAADRALYEAKGKGRNQTCRNGMPGNDEAGLPKCMMVAHWSVTDERPIARAS